MWHDLEGSTSIDTGAANSEPASPRPSATLPSAALPIGFASNPSYTIGTRSHSFATEHLKPVPVSPLIPSMSGSEETNGGTTLPTPTSPSSTSLNYNNRLHSHHRTKSSSSTSSSPSTSEPNLGQDASTNPASPSATMAVNTSLSRQSSLSLNLNRHSSLSKKQSKQQQSQQQDRDNSVPASPSSTHRPQKHVMLKRRSVSQDFQLRLQQQQQRQEDLGEELSEAGEDQAPGTPTSISSFGSGTMGGEKERDRSLVGRHNRLSRSSVALIESRNIQTLSSNLAMVSSPTDSEFLQQSSDALLSTIAQKEARIAQLREDLETNLSELTQLKERWSQMMIEERNRQHAEVTASIQEQERQGGGQSMSHRLSSTGAGIWGSVVGSVSGISGVSGGISLHNINAAHHHTHSHSVGSPGGRSNSSNNTGKWDSQGTSTSSRPTSPLPAYLNNFSSLNGLHPPLSPSERSNSVKKGDRTSMSSLSTCSSSQSNSGDVPSAFEAGHSSQSSISSSGQPDQNAQQIQLYKEQRELRKNKRESSGLFIPPEAEDVLVNTGRAIFKGFGSLLGGIRTVVTDVTESDRFQHSRQKTIDMVSGLAQTAADALPLPSHDDIYYHHQRLRLLDEEEEEAVISELRLQQQQAKEQRRRERQKEKERGLIEKEQGGSSSERPGVSRSSSLIRRTSRKSKAESNETEDTGLSMTVNSLSIRENSRDSQGLNSSEPTHDDDDASGWGMEDKELLESLEADAREQEIKMNKIDPELESPLDTPVRIEPSTTTTTTTSALASKKND